MGRKQEKSGESSENRENFEAGKNNFFDLPAEVDIGSEGAAGRREKQRTPKAARLLGGEMLPSCFGSSCEGDSVPMRDLHIRRGSAVKKHKRLRAAGVKHGLKAVRSAEDSPAARGNLQLSRIFPAPGKRRKNIPLREISAACVSLEAAWPTHKKEDPEKPGLLIA